MAHGLILATCYLLKSCLQIIETRDHSQSEGIQEHPKSHFSHFLSLQIPVCKWQKLLDASLLTKLKAFTETGDIY